MYSIDKALAWISFSLIAICVLVGPWIFGAWEAWHFWPFTTLIFISAFAFSLRLLMKAYRAELHRRTKWTGTSLAGKFTRAGFALYGVFLAYALVRSFYSEVHADAERSFLLLLTPYLIAAQIVFSFSRKQNTAIFWMITANLLLLGVYGITNHLFFHNAYTMWLPGEPQYQLGFFRATGSYVCPDHFSGIMEFALGIGLAMTLTKMSRTVLKAAGTAIALIGISGVFFSKSRGGGLTVLVMLPACLTFCLFTWNSKIKLYLRSTAALCAILAISLLLATGNSYAQRFTSYFGYDQVKHKPIAEAINDIKIRLNKHTARGPMYSAAYRAWKTSPAFGIGAGMHQNLWPHFAASPDGNRASMDWPAQINNTWHSYEVHNDWLQLLEEYGLAGLALFLVPFTCLIFALGSIRRELASSDDPPPHQSLVLSAAILALAAMTFHSLGDFNLQMPATTWMLAILVTLPLNEAARPTDLIETDV